MREPRKITIQPNLAAWLEAYPLEKYQIIPANVQHLCEKAVEKSDFTHGVMRHTFISMFVAKFRSIGEAALQSGNSQSIPQALPLKDTAEADDFWSIRPQKFVEKVDPKGASSSASLRAAA